MAMGNRQLLSEKNLRMGNGAEQKQCRHWILSDTLQTSANKHVEFSCKLD
jgi:hypothetical protein